MKQQLDSYETTAWLLWNNSLTEMKQQLDPYKIKPAWILWNNSLTPMKQQLDSYETTARPL
jgi:hypothetical protein